jgi:hypothetical protein
MPSACSALQETALEMADGHKQAELVEEVAGVCQGQPLQEELSSSCRLHVHPRRQAGPRQPRTAAAPAEEMLQQAAKDGVVPSSPWPMQQQPSKGNKEQVCILWQWFHGSKQGCTYFVLRHPWPSL